MSRRVRRKLGNSRGQEEVGGLGIDENKNVDEGVVVDWTRLPDDTVIQLFASLNLRDRASLSSTCRAWRALGMSECLWQQLDLRSYKFDSAIAPSLASRCENLKKIRFRSAESAEAIIHLKARGLREISGEYCRKITDATLAMVVARHEALESLQLGPDFCERITTSAIKAVSFCCPCLRKLRLCGLRYVDGDAINALAKHCKNLMDIGFVDCLNVDEVGIGQVLSLKFLSVAGTTNMKWILASQHWSELPNLIGLDVSRTDIPCSAVERMFLASKSLKVLCALYCPALDKSANFLYNNNKNGKLLLTLCTDIFKEVASLFVDTINKERNIFLEWRQLSTKVKKPEEIMHWLEWVISHSLLRIAEVNPQGLDTFWLNQGAYVFLSLTQSTQEEVQERAATGIATFVVIDEESSTVDAIRAEAVMKDDGIRLLLNRAKCWQDGIQSEATKAIANLSMNGNVAKAVAEEGGISILANLARSMNRLVAEEAAGGLWNLSVGEEHKASIAETGGLKALVGLIFRWLVNGGEVVLERATGALANLAADEKCSMEIASVGGVQALVTLAQNCKIEGVQEQAARALANLAAHGDSNNNNASVGQEAGALEALVLLTHSPHDGVRQEAAGALWNLSFDDSNREAIAATGGVEALVALAKSCFDASPALQERAAGALWGLSVSETNSIAIGQEGGIAPLIALARVEVEDVHETAAGALWNLAFNPGNALRIVEEGGVPALVHLCSTSVSKMARFMATLALAYIFDGRMDEVALVGSSLENASKSVNLNGARRMALRYIEAFVLAFSDPQAFSAASASSAPTALTQVTELARIHEAGHLRCSGAEIGRFVKMLQNPSSVLKACAAFALLQFTIRSGRHANHHARLLQNPSASRILRAAAASASAPLEAKIFARIVLRNLEHYQRQNLLLH